MVLEGTENGNSSKKSLDSLVQGGK